MSDKGFDRKQMGDACEMLVAAELTLAGVPALRVPDNWPGYDVIAHPPNDRPQRISVKSRTLPNVGFLKFSPGTTDWQANVLLERQSRHFFIVPQDVVDKLSAPDKNALSRRLNNATIFEKLASYRDNFTLRRFDIQGEGLSAIITPKN